MAERRMFAKSIIDSDAFLDMPITARLLYYDLAMRADDDGFVNAPKKIMKFVGASADDISILILRKFVLDVGDGVVVIKHWRIHNYIQNDRYKETTYKDKKALLEFDENKAYKQCIQNGYNLDTQVRLGKDSLGKVNNIGAESTTSATTNRFVKPTIEEIKAYMQEKGYTFDAERLYDYYESNGWRVGKGPMKNWKCAVNNWNRNEFTYSGGKQRYCYPKEDYEGLNNETFDEEELSYKLFGFNDFIEKYGAERFVDKYGQELFDKEMREKEKKN